MIPGILASSLKQLQLLRRVAHIKTKSFRYRLVINLATRPLNSITSWWHRQKTIKVVPRQQSSFSRADGNLLALSRIHFDVPSRGNEEIAGLVEEKGLIKMISRLEVNPQHGHARRTTHQLESLRCRWSPSVSVNTPGFALHHLAYGYVNQPTKLSRSILVYLDVTVQFVTYGRLQSSREFPRESSMLADLATPSPLTFWSSYPPPTAKSKLRWISTEWYPPKRNHCPTCSPGRLPLPYGAKTILRLFVS